MSTPTVLAFDLSFTATGVATPDGFVHTIKPSTKGDRRLPECRAFVRQLLEDWRPSLVVIEGPVVRSPAAVSIGMLQGAVRSLLLEWDYPYLVVPPANVKKYATGRGNAPKPDLRMEFFKRTGQDFPDDNQVDAAWLRLLALDLLGVPEVDMPKVNREALKKLTPPKEYKL